MSNFNKVGIFMKTFGQEVKSKPSFSTDKINKLRIDLIKEELDELKVAMDNNDLLWLGTNRGLMTKSVDEPFKAFPELQGETIWSIYQEKKGNMWFTTDKGATMYDGSSFQYFGEKDGFVDGRVRKMAEDKQGNFWFATNKGIYRYNGKSFKNIEKDTKLMLTASKISSILINITIIFFLFKKIPTTPIVKIIAPRVK